LLACAVGLIRLAATASPTYAAPGTACPEFPRRVQAEAVHFAPGIVRHQSWIDFTVPRAFSGYFAFCLDGQLLQLGGGDMSYGNGIARFSVSTSWIDVLAVRGDLDDYRNAHRWELRLLCAPQTPC
jgi:hypothetical protein